MGKHTHIRGEMQNIILIIIALLSILAFIWGCQSDKKEEKTSKDTRVISKNSNRSEIVRKLKTLAKYPVKNPNVTVTCYVSSIPQPDSTNLISVYYICPVCSSRTKYLKQDLGYDFVTIRRMVGQIKDADIKLDETAFCKKCQPTAAYPNFALDIKIKGENKEIHTDYITIDDINLLINFFNNDFNYISTDSLQRQKSIERLETLLGLGKSGR